MIGSRAMPRTGASSRLLASGAASALLASAFVSGCKMTPKHPEPVGAPVLAPSAVGIVGPARWFPIADTGESTLEEADPDGSVRSIEHGLRLVEHRDGRLERGGDVLPAGKQMGALRLPPRVGGGY